jgi:hypothetical protein
VAHYIVNKYKACEKKMRRKLEEDDKDGGPGSAGAGLGAVV